MLFSRDTSTWKDIVNQTYDIEFDYIAIDKHFQIAVLSTFNRAYTPSCVTKSFDLFLLLDHFIDTLSKSTNAVYARQDNKGKNFNDWQTYGELGFFAYDNQDVHRLNEKELKQFDIIYKPITPLLSTQLVGLNKFSEIIPRFNLTFGENIKFEDLRRSLVE